MKLLKAVHYVDGSVFGGCEQVVLTLIEGLISGPWRCVLLHHDEVAMRRLAREADGLGVECITLPRRQEQTGVGMARQIFGALRRIQPEIFHAHLNWPLACRHGIVAARLARVPLITATAHLYVPLLGVRFGLLKQRIQSAAIDRYIAVSTEVRNRLIQDLGVPSKAIRLVRNGIRTDTFGECSDDAFRAELSDGVERPLVLTPARLHAQKGHEYLLKAVVDVPRALFLFAGTGPEEGRLRQLAENLGVQKRVKFLGHRDDMATLLSNCDLFVLPSLYEGLPLTILEAMAAGKPVIATAVGGSDEAVVDGLTGCLVPPRDAQSLASAINRMLADESLAAQMAAGGQARVRQMFSAESMVRGVENVYEELLGTRAPITRSDSQ